MRRFAPKTLFLTAATLLLIGVIVPFLMVMDIAPKLLWLELFIGVIQFIGLTIGIMGTILYVKEKKK